MASGIFEARSVGVWWDRNMMKQRTWAMHPAEALTSLGMTHPPTWWALRTCVWTMGKLEFDTALFCGTLSKHFLNPCLERMAWYIDALPPTMSPPLTSSYQIVIGSIFCNRWLSITILDVCRQFLDTYYGHSGPVYRVRCNPFMFGSSVVEFGIFKGSRQVATSNACYLADRTDY